MSTSLKIVHITVCLERNFNTNNGLKGWKMCVCKNFILDFRRS